MAFTAIAGSSTLTPRIEIYTTLACNFLIPECGERSQQPGILGFPHSNDCRIPAVAHQSSVDISDVFMIDKSLQTSNGVDTPPTREQRCASDPVVQAAVAKLTTSAYSVVFSPCTSTCTCSLSLTIRLLKNFLSLDDYTFLLMTDPHSIFTSHHDVHGNS